MLACICFAVLSASNRQAAPASAFESHPLPWPTGRYMVSTVILPIEESEKTHTHRRVQLWFPGGESRYANPVKYVPDKDTMAAIRSQQLLGQTPAVYDAWAKMESGALEPPPPLDGKKFPLVLFMPGLGMPALCYSSYAEQLASDGYLVASIDFGDGGFLVQNGKLLSEGPTGNDEASYGKTADDWAVQCSEIIEKMVEHTRPFSYGRAETAMSQVDFHKIAVVGHSEGGAASLEAARRDKRISACVDLDGVPVGFVADHGVQTSVLFLRSHVDYSDADLEKLHRSRAQWDARGKQIVDSLQKLFAGPGGDAWVISINGTNHVSFSDLPFTAPQAISHYGGKIIEPRRLYHLWTGLIEGYLNHQFAGRPFPHKMPPEAAIQISRAKSRQASRR